MRIFNTLTRTKEALVPLSENHIRMYVCGVTVYDFCHLGHARCEVAFDVINRYFRHKGYKVTLVRNITDIDDKIIQRAQENNENISVLTERMIQAMHEDYRLLGVLPPDCEPRATAYVSEMQSMIQTLIDKSYAYVSSKGDVYYRVQRFSGYGKLSGKIIEDLESGARVEKNTDKENPLDFVLWKASKSNEPSWLSPWGPGRPGWHIECSTMCLHTLGTTLDIHGGGPDLKFPHHENEIAQSEAAHGKLFARCWMHVGALRVNDEKMSKSLGNFFTVRDVLKRYTPEIIRYFLISSHYRSPMYYTDSSSLQEASNCLNRLYGALEGVSVQGVEIAQDTLFEKKFHDAMEDDFNTPAAMSVLFELAHELNISKKKNEPSTQSMAALLVKLGGILGILQQSPMHYLQRYNEVDPHWVELMIQQRNAAKKRKDYQKADQIRADLAGKGIQLLDGRDGTTWRAE